MLSFFGRLRFSILLACLAVLVVAIAPALFGQVDSTGSPSPTAGLLLPILTFLSPVAKTLLVSGLMYAANTGLGVIAGWSNQAKYVVLGVLGIAVSYLGNLIGLHIGPDTSSWTAATAEGLASAVIAGVVFRIGKAAS